MLKAGAVELESRTIGAFDFLAICCCTPRCFFANRYQYATKAADIATTKQPKAPTANCNVLKSFICDSSKWYSISCDINFIIMVLIGIYESVGAPTEPPHRPSANATARAIDAVPTHSNSLLIKFFIRLVLLFSNFMKIISMITLSAVGFIHYSVDVASPPRSGAGIKNRVTGISVR